MTERQVRFNPDEPRKLDDIVRGSYEDFVRLERRNLLAVSSLILFFVFSKAKLTDVNFFGVKLDHVSTENVFVVLFFIGLYFLVAYSIYAYPGFRDAGVKWKELKNTAMKIGGNKFRFSIWAKNALSTARYWLWVFVHYIFPFLIGLLSVVWALCKVA